ncbi:MAG TPA: hypothetical protein PLJ37_00760 [Chitinophagales bacterium]|nr:hypothetical protein [Chitinophagales bacterium]HMW93482.1 hypothetical protein [Chitinophagales bacterium]HMZ92895.1 hypothetical protein [Chitinophagales bacterium]HNG25916.1 hypothetical protein [Chitinophagales bacterium]
MKNFFENIKIKKNEGNIIVSYTLIGPKGAEYFLVRNIHDHLLYSDRKIKGYNCFTDRNGPIEPVRRY